MTIYEFKQDFLPIYAMGEKDIVTVTGASCVPGKNEFIPIWRPVLNYGKTMMMNMVEYFNVAVTEVPQLD